MCERERESVCVCVTERERQLSKGTNVIDASSLLSGFGLQTLGFGGRQQVQDSRSRNVALFLKFRPPPRTYGCRALGEGCRIRSFGFGVWVLGFGVQSLGFGVSRGSTPGRSPPASRARPADTLCPRTPAVHQVRVLTSAISSRADRYIEGNGANYIHRLVHFGGLVAGFCPSRRH